MDPAKIIGADAHFMGLAVHPGADGSSRVSLNRLELDDIGGDLGFVTYRAEALILDKVEARPGRRQISADAVHLTGARLRTPDGNMVLTVPRIGFPSGFQVTSKNELFAPHASLEDAHLEIHDISALRGHRRQDAAPTPAEQAGSGYEPDLRLFDALSGYLNVDLVVDLTLPWIGRRKATHYFRVPIKDGTIDFAKLEEDVHWLNGAFLTLDVVDDKLVLARDLPLMPYAGKALLQWKLEPADVPLARYQRVHLRNLLRWEAPPPSRDRGKPKVVLHAIAMEKIRLDLSTTAPTFLELRNGSSLQIGDEEQPGVVDLHASGSLRHAAGEPPAATTVRGSVGLIDITVKELALGAMALSADRLHIGGIDHIEIGFEGFQPRRLSATLGRLAATNLRLHLP